MRLVAGRKPGAARQIGIDPIEIRRKNLIRPDQFPYENPSGLHTASGGAKISIDSGNYEPAMDMALATAGLGLVADTNPAGVCVGGRPVTVREPRVPRPHFASAEELERHRAFIAHMASPLWERFAPSA